MFGHEYRREQFVESSKNNDIFPKGRFEENL